MVGLAQNLSFILLGEDRSASRTMTDAEATATRTTGRIGSAFSKIGDLIGGEFGSQLGAVGSKIEDMDGKAAHLGKTLEIGGGIVTTAGIGLMQLGSGEQQATDQLKASITAAGQSYDDYSKKIDEAVAKGENFDHSAIDTKNALQILTDQTGNTQKSLDTMGVVTDLAAQKHISLAEAAQLVARIMTGSGGRTLAQYGIVMDKVTGSAASLTKAQNGVTTAQDALAAAQKRVSDLEEIDHAKKKLSVSDHIALQNAQDAVTKASGKLSDAQKTLADAQSNTETKTQAGQKALDELAQKLNGQGSASVNNFGSQVDIVRQKIQDWVEEVAGPVGSTMTALGPVVSAAGIAIDLYAAKQERAAAAAAAISASAIPAAAGEASIGAAAEGAAPEVDTLSGAMDGLDGAMDANPIGLVAGAIGAVALVAGGSILGNLAAQKQKVDDLTTAYENDNLQIGKNMQMQAAKDLQASGALDAAQKLGISTDILVKASLGDNTAKQQLHYTYQQLNQDMADQKKAYEEQGINATAIATMQANEKIAISKVKDAVGDETSAMQSAVSTGKQLAEAAGLVTSKTDGATGSVKNLNVALRTLPAAVATNVTVTTSGSASAGLIGRHAGGGDITSSQWSWVGEKGPELVRLPGASSVYTASQSAGMAAVGGGGGGDVHVHVAAPPGLFVGNTNDMAKQLMTMVISGFRSGQLSKTEFRNAIGLS